MTTQLETDYLIIGSGAMGLAFADVILAETEANMIIVDAHAKPGGHWNDAYPFVTLHQPSTFYGVSSVELSSGDQAKLGLNKGLLELATGDEILAYYDRLMREMFLPSGRVQYFPMCEYSDDGQFRSKLTGQGYQVAVKRKTVDSTYLKSSVPSTHTPSFDIDPRVNFIPLNKLPELQRPYQDYVVVGGGKTGIDACLWLLEHGVQAKNICWVMPRDAWLLDRVNTQNTEEFFSQSVGAQAAQLECIAKAQSIGDLFDRLEQAGVLLRIDTGVRPSMFHGATVSQAELIELRQIKRIVRKGRVTQIKRGSLIFEDQSTEQINQDAVFIDCSASAATLMPIVPIFDGDHITIQTVRGYQPTFSAAFVAHIEACFSEDNGVGNEGAGEKSQKQTKKNNLCGVVPLPNTDFDWLRLTAATMFNQFAWSQEPGLRSWVANNRLDGFSKMILSVNKEDADKVEILKKMKRFAGPAMQNLQTLLSKQND